MRRRPEAYHATLVAYERVSSGGGGVQTSGPEPPGCGRQAATAPPKTIHDIVATKEPGLSRLLVYDRHERRSALLHAVPRSTETAALAEPGFAELETWSMIHTAWRGPATTSSLPSATAWWPANPCWCGRRSGWPAGGSTHRWTSPSRSTHRGDVPINVDLVLEWNVDLAGGGGNPAAYYAVPADGPVHGAPSEGAVRRYTHDSSEHPGVLGSLSFGNAHEGAEVRATPTPAADVAWYPVETVSNSEAGFERQYQGSCLLLRWPLALEPAARAAFRVRFDVTSSRDHRAEER